MRSSSPPLSGSRAKGPVRDLVHAGTDDRVVMYDVTGDDTNQASITYETPTGTGQQSDVDLPLTTLR